MNPLSLIGRLMPQEMTPLPQPSVDKLKPIPLSELEGLQGASGIKGGSFDNVLGKLVNEVNSKQIDAKNTVANMMSGGEVSMHQAMIAMEEASVSFQLMVEVRNKLLESYQEIMRMQL